MDRSLLLDNDLHVQCGDWYRMNERFVYFYVRTNPAGMKFMKGLDGDASFDPSDLYHASVRAALLHAGLTDDDLDADDGFEKFAKHLEKMSIRKHDEVLISLLVNGLTFFVTCHEDSPLFSWFLVLGGKNGRSGDSLHWR
jgi:hypothetical protein